MYLNILEVKSALSVASSPPFDTFTQLIPLPNLTWEQRQCNAIKIAAGSDGNRPGVYFLGCVHAREWGSADILINFVEQVEQAYHSKTSLTFRTRTFSAAEIQTIVNTLDIVVFPQANPDGRNYSMTPGSDAMWRKNRRTASPNSVTPDACVGVDKQLGAVARLAVGDAEALEKVTGTAAKRHLSARQIDGKAV